MTTKTEALKAMSKALYNPVVQPPSLKSGHSLRDATEEELKEMREIVRQRVERARKAAASATQYRPAYTPAARLTRSESLSRNMLAWEEAVEAGITAAIILTQAGISREVYHGR